MVTNDEIKRNFENAQYECETAREILLIEGRREGYSFSQIRRTMTVGELIDFLEDYDRDTLVYLNNDNHYSYGGITTSSFSSGEVNESQYEGHESYREEFY